MHATVHSATLLALWVGLSESVRRITVFHFRGAYHAIEA